MEPLLVADTKAGVLLAAAFGEAECGLADMALAVGLALGDAAAALGTAGFGEAAAALGIMNVALGGVAAAFGDTAAVLGETAAALGDMAAVLGETAAACKVLPSCMLAWTAPDLGDAACICEGITSIFEELSAALASLLTGVSEGILPRSLGTSTCLTGAIARTCCSLLAACELGKSPFLLPSCLPTLLPVLLCLATAFTVAFAPQTADFDLPG